MKLKTNRAKYYSSNLGAAFSEFALSFVVVLLLILGVLDFSNYLTQANIMQAAAYEAAAKAAWHPGLNLQASINQSGEVTDPPLNQNQVVTSENKFYDAFSELVNDIKTGVSSRVKLNESNPKLVTYTPRVAGQANAFQSSTNSIVVALPAVGTDGTRDALMASQPVSPAASSSISP